MLLIIGWTVPLKDTHHLSSVGSMFVLPLLLSFSFFLFFFSGEFKQHTVHAWHVALHLSHHTGHSWSNWQPFPSAFSPPYLFPVPSLILRTPPHFQNHSASMTEVTWLRGQHRVTFASPQHFQTQWRGRMSRDSECLTKKHTPELFRSPGEDKTQHVSDDSLHLNAIIARQT